MTTKKRIPSYRKHKATGQAVVSIHGKDFYLGKHNTATSRKEYDRLIAEYLVSGRLPSDDGCTVVELINAFWKHAKAYYRKDGQPTSEISGYKCVLRHVRQLYGTTPVAEFGPLRLKAVRQKLIEEGWKRTTINSTIGKVRRMFRWGVEQEIVPPSVFHGLQAIVGLRKGRSEAIEPAPVLPVEDTQVALAMPQMPPTVADMVRVQRLTGMRPGEVVAMTPGEIDRAGEVWIYKPESHKTEHHERERVIPIGPKTQAILTAYLFDREPEEPLFSPNESERLRSIERRRQRKTPVQPSQRNRKQKNRQRKPGREYTTTTYARAVRRACEDAELKKHWTPNQLRHTRATEIRREFGLEAAQVTLGHAQANVTQVYAERDMQKALEVAKASG
jgi:integrase